MSKDDAGGTREYHKEVQNLRAELTALEGGGEGSTPPLRRVSATTAYADTLDTLRLLLSRPSGRNYTESVDLTRNAKGETQITVSGQAHEDETLDQCAARVQTVYEQLRARFPLASGYVGAEGGSGGRAT